MTVPASAESVSRRTQRAPQPSQAELPQQSWQPRQPQPQQTYQAMYPQAQLTAHQPPPAVQDPPIYRALIRIWADRGRTLPGRHDPEWCMLVAPPVPRGPFSASPDPRGDGR